MPQSRPRETGIKENRVRYPVLRIIKDKVLSNARVIADMCGSLEIDVWGVTKGLSGDPRLAALYEEAGFKGVSDSRIRNLKKIKMSGVSLPRQLMRIAMRSELEDMPDIVDVSLQSEPETIRRLDEIYARRGVTGQVLLMIDVGDLREGFWPRELPRAGEYFHDLRGGVEITGVAANFACASGLLPSPENLERLVSYRDMLQDSLDYELPVISVGGTCCLKLIEEKKVPRQVNQVRVCEGVLLGMDTAFNREIPYLERDALTIVAEIIECKHKPSVPSGEIGLQSFGERPIFIDRGMRKRALLGIGRQDVNVDRIIPLEQGVHIVTASSDHLIVDVTEADSTCSGEDFYKLGDTISFRPLYPAMLAASTSEFVELCFE
ncbi:MAG: alanine racemase [Synergistaceae bacterium]|jgi:predicted amino acid racemase|nr:alanine racemase [Synergistaceae bacterium]